jgi:hypothetical protein
MDQYNKSGGVTGSTNSTRTQTIQQPPNANLAIIAKGVVFPST